MAQTQHSSYRQLLTILMVVFLGFLGISMPYLIFPALFLNPDYSIIPSTWSHSSHALFLGITLAAYPLGQFLGSPILGALSDDYGRKPLLTWSLVVAAICNLLTGLAIGWQQLTLVILSRFAAGMMEGNVAIARAMAADIKSIPKHETFGKINAAVSIAYLLGPLLGGLLADNQIYEGVTSSTPFYIISILFIALALLTALILENKKALSSDEAPKEKRSVWARFRLMKRMSFLFQNRRLKFLMISSTFFTLAVDIFYEFGPVYLTDKWVLAPVQLITYNSMVCIALAVGNGWFAGYFSKRYPSPLGIIGAMGGFALFMLGTVLINQPVLMMMLFGLCGLVIGLGVTLITVKISDSVADNIQGEVMGVQLSLRVLGDAVICLLGGALLLLSSKLILVLAAIISAGTMIYYALQK